MKFLKNKVSGILLTAAAVLFISGCDDVTKKKEATISYINALDEQASFYVKKSSASGSIFNSEHLATTELRGDYSDGFKHKWTGVEKNQLAVENTNTREYRANMQLSLDNNYNYWLVAYLEKKEYKLSFFQKSSSNRADSYRVRVLANDKLDIYIDGITSKHLTTKTGQVTEYFSVEKCTGLVIEGNSIDLCTGDFGRSYLAVVNKDGLISLARE